MISVFYGVLSANVATFSLVLGFLLFFKAKHKGLGWLFPLGALMVCAGTIKLINSFLYAGITTGIEADLQVLNALDRMVADALIVLGLGLGLLRLRMGIVSNSVLVWGWLLSSLCFGCVLFIYVMAKGYLQTTSISSLPYAATYVALAAISLYLFFRFHRVIAVSIFSLMLSVSFSFASLSSSVSALSQFFALGLEATALFWMLLYVIINTDGLSVPYRYARRSK